MEQSALAGAARSCSGGGTDAETGAAISTATALPAQSSARDTNKGVNFMDIAKPARSEPSSSVDGKWAQWRVRRA